MRPDGFVRVAVAVPRGRVSEPIFNVASTIELTEEAADAGAAVVAFPEMNLSGYSNDDLFHQTALVEQARDALAQLVRHTTALQPLVIVGLPVLTEGRLFNCAAVLHRGQVLGVVPKSYLPNYREFYEKRQFAAARDALRASIHLFDEEIPFGADLLFQFDDSPGLCVHVEICEDVWVPLPPSTFAAMAGATVLVNLSASNITIGKDAYRRRLCQAQSAKLLAAYLYTSAGHGESTTDLAWDGHAMIYENGELLAETRRFGGENQLAIADVDLASMLHERMQMTSFTDCATDHRDALLPFRVVRVETSESAATQPLRRHVSRFPFVPSDPATLDEHCEEAFNIQVEGLTTRLSATGIERLVIGVSGGLDSTHALLVACRAMDRLQLSRENVLGYSMPGFATSSSTRSNALRLMDALGISAHEIDIRPSAQQMLTDLQHPAATGATLYDVTFENVQAGERTSHLFRLANMHRALVVGTGDLSELALGWCTFGVGDQMAHYNVNASVPKTLIAYLVRWVAAHEEFGDAASQTLAAIAETTISPELVPSGTATSEPTQSTEDLIGPYELHDFFLYRLLRYGDRPSRILALAHHAWADPSTGTWPHLIPPSSRNSYDLPELAHWLRIFLERFFVNQFKRSTMPNGPKIGSGGSLSPRGDWRAPSDASANVWLDELDAYLATVSAVCRALPLGLAAGCRGSSRATAGR